MLAVAIGTAHGLYQGDPQLDIDLLRAIRARVDIPLALHGGSGCSDAQFRATIENGISKINVATNLFRAAGQAVADAAQAGETSYWSFSKATTEAFEVQAGYYADLFGATGKS